jgi:hypothetical protein
LGEGLVRDIEDDSEKVWATSTTSGIQTAHKHFHMYFSLKLTSTVKEIMQVFENGFPETMDQCIFQDFIFQAGLIIRIAVRDSSSDIFYEALPDSEAYYFSLL